MNGNEETLSTFPYKHKHFNADPESQRGLLFVTIGY